MIARQLAQDVGRTALPVTGADRFWKLPADIERHWRHQLLSGGPVDPAGRPGHESQRSHHRFGHDGRDKSGERAGPEHKWQRRRPADRLSLDGELLAVGAYGEDSSSKGVNGDETDNRAGRSGAVYVFLRTGGLWAQEAYLKASNTEGGFPAGDFFGASVAVSDDAIVVGATGEDSIATGVNGDQSNNSARNSGTLGSRIGLPQSSRS